MKIDDLTTLCAEATPGPWSYNTCYGVAFITAKGYDDVASVVSYLTPNNADFMVVFDPPMVKLMLDVIAEATVAVTEAYWVAGDIYIPALERTARDKLTEKLQTFRDHVEKMR